jgi:hypothetical protein
MVFVQQTYSSNYWTEINLLLFSGLQMGLPALHSSAMHGQQIPPKILHLSSPIEHQIALVESSCPPVRDAGMNKDSEATVSLGSGDDMSWDLLEKSQSSHNLAMVTDEDIGSCQLVEHTDGIQNSCTEDVLMNSEEAELSKWPDISNMPMVLNATEDVGHMSDSTTEHLG